MYVLYHKIRIFSIKNSWEADILIGPPAPDGQRRDIKFSALADAAVKIYGADNRTVYSHLRRVGAMGPFHYVRLEHRVNSFSSTDVPNLRFSTEPPIIKNVPNGTLEFDWSACARWATGETLNFQPLLTRR